MNSGLNETKGNAKYSRRKEIGKLLVGKAFFRHETKIKNCKINLRSIMPIKNVTQNYIQNCLLTMFFKLYRKKDQEKCTHC